MACICMLLYLGKRERQWELDLCCPDSVAIVQSKQCSGWREPSYYTTPSLMNYLWKVISFKSRRIPVYPPIFFYFYYLPGFFFCSLYSRELSNVMRVANFKRISREHNSNMQCGHFCIIFLRLCTIVFGNRRPSYHPQFSFLSFACSGVLSVWKGTTVDSSKPRWRGFRFPKVSSLLLGWSVSIFIFISLLESCREAVWRNYILNT
jgi:hypothetical protein